ncbi:MAG: chemotaxis-specific protein-glutamate methyltransferase CheB [Phycisphaerales bacterium]|nr:chemotaxis-specific protein-glutamate methyltransferase CheB [Phycisphaerales bacterium]
MRVAIVNDLRMATEALRRIVEMQDGLELAWTAMDGREAVEKTGEDLPDLILMDLVMPEMDGETATRIIMEEHPCPILVVTASVTGNARRVVKAMAAGAIDAIETPTFGLDGRFSGDGPLLDRIDRLMRDPAGFREVVSTSRPNATPTGSVSSSPRRPSIMLIGASTGGPQAIRTVISALPRPLSIPVVVVQHIDHQFVGGLVHWLQEVTGHTVVESAPGAIEPGVVVVASTNEHLVLSDRGYAHRPDTEDRLHRPSVDELFASAAETSHHGIAVLLTGMGTDGAVGLERLRAAGWHTIAQDEASSAVWGMPAAAIRAGAAVETLPLDEIGPRVASRLGVPGDTR